MPGENILVIAVDGLRAASLGAYGNTSFATPALDQLAADSFLLDFCFADAVDLPSIYQALWYSRHPLRAKPVHGTPGLARVLRQRGYTTTLVTDEPALAALPGADDFDDLVQLTESEPARADDLSQTCLARLFTAASDTIASGRSNSIVWVHARAFYGPWDAPLELQESLLERDEATDPDLPFRWSCAYAAQVVALDACVEALCESLAGAAGRGWLVVLLGTRGYPLGEHGRIGGVDGRLYAEQLHVPMLLRFPEGTGRLMRSGQLTSPLDLLPTLVDWLGDPPTATHSFDGASITPEIRLAPASSRSALVAIGDNGAQAIRTPEWTFRSDDTTRTREIPGELFVRPDDRWEANDVASLCLEVVDDLQRRLAEVAASMENPTELP
jgi:arylsulfatase A-like enzyme